MKRLFIFMLSLLMGFSLFAQKLVVFPDGKLMGADYKPRMGISSGSDAFSGGLILLQFTDSYSYAEFDDKSRIVFKLADDSRISCPIVPGYVQKDYKSEWLDILNRFADFYYTYTGYSCPDELIDAVINNGQKIVKIRLVFADEEIKDYDIAKGYQAKFISKLQKYYKDAQAEEEREKNIPSDDEF